MAGGGFHFVIAEDGEGDKKGPGPVETQDLPLDILVSQYPLGSREEL